MAQPSKALEVLQKMTNGHVLYSSMYSAGPVTYWLQRRQSGYNPGADMISSHVVKRLLKLGHIEVKSRKPFITYYAVTPAGDKWLEELEL